MVVSQNCLSYYQYRYRYRSIDIPVLAQLAVLNSNYRLGTDNMVLLFEQHESKRNLKV